MSASFHAVIVVAGDASADITLPAISGNTTYDISLVLQGYGYDIPQDIINVPADVPNIQFALDNAQWGDTIKVVGPKDIYVLSGSMTASRTSNQIVGVSGSTSFDTQLTTGDNIRIVSFQRQ